MTSLLSLLLNPTVLAILGVIVGFFGWGKYKERVGAKKEIAKRDAADRRVRDISDDIQNDVGAMTPEQIDAALRKRAKK